jgi:tRNA/tmRNA/rRNA uracil-C5-methylase (TrmA/RlmC/RlmD family)
MPLEAVVPVAASPEAGYRMRARLHVRNSEIGLFREGTHDLCDPATGGQFRPETADVLQRIGAMLAPLGRSRASIELAENVGGTERAAHLDVEGPLRDPDALRLDVEGLTGSSIQLGPRVRTLHGDPTVRDDLASLPGMPALAEPALVRRHAAAFFQANRHLLGTLVSSVVAHCDGAGPVTELYAGVGLFSVALAASTARVVTAVEGDRISGHDLEANAAPFGERLRAVIGAVEDFLAGESAAAGETLIVDPPRTGMSRAAVDGIIARRVRRIIYVSCDVATVARDVRRLVDARYALGHIAAFDLFPNTPHIETMVVLDAI